MKTTIHFLSLYLLCNSYNLVAQNLVSNPSFEIANRLPARKVNSINRAKDWIAPVAYSDYYMKGRGRQVGTPKNIFGRQKPHSGIAYAGICTRTKYLEYLETKLIDTLKKDQEYLVEFYVSKAERSLGSVKEFGVLFTSKTMWGLTSRGIAIKPQILFSKPNGYRNKKNWIKLSAVYKAEGNESVLILGHFNYNPRDDKRRIFCHYYIDDVSVTPIISKTDTIVSAKTEAQAPKLFVPKLGEIVRLQNIFFNTNKSELLPESFVELDKLVDYLSDMKNTSIIISGHTDNIGNTEQNKKLSEARAKAVANYLILKGIDEMRITYIGYGSTKPIATNNTDEDRQLNRRVEFIINKE